MTEPQKKGTEKNIVIILGVLVLIFAILSVYVYMTMNSTYQNYVSTHTYTNIEYDSLFTTYQDYVSIHSYTDTEYDALNATYQNYIMTHSHTDSEYNSQYSTLQSQVADLQAQLDSLTADYQNYIASHTYTNLEYNLLQSQIVSLQNQITSLQSQVNNLNNIVNLAGSTIWVNSQTISQPASSYTYWTASASYAGYISVYVQSSTTTNTYVEVVWSAYGVSYDNTITIGVSGTAVFPVLPASNIQIRVGNTNLINGATETVTVTYHY